MIILSLIPALVFLSASVLSIIYLIDVFYNIRRYSLRITKRHRTMSVCMFILCTFLSFYTLGLFNFMIAFAWFLATSIWLLNAIMNNRAVVKIKNQEIVEQPKTI